MIKYDEKEFIEITLASSTMAQAASKMGIHFNTHRRIAKKLGCYSKNQGGKGINKKMPTIPLNDILNGKYPDYQTFKLKERLLKEGIKTNKCEICGINEWNNMTLNCELDHIDGNRTNHCLENLRIICPNCHSQTSTFRSKNIKRKE